MRTKVLCATLNVKPVTPTCLLPYFFFTKALFFFVVSDWLLAAARSRRHVF